MGLLVIYVSLAIGVSFLCSILEAVLLSLTPSYITAEMKQRPEHAKKLEVLKADVERPLSAILTLNTIAHTVGATGAGAQALAVFGDAAVGIFSVFLTLAILILSEIIPKSIGATYWRQLAPFAARILPPMMTILAPFVWLSQKVTNLFKRVEDEPSMSMDELRAISELGLEEGLIERDEFVMLKNFLRFGSLQVETVMTPKPVVFHVPATMTADEFLADHRTVPFSRIPLYGAKEDDTVGYVLKSSVHLAVLEGRGQTSLDDLKREIVVVEKKTEVKKLFRTFLQRSEHIALVVGDYGAMAGIATMEDLLETMLGLEIKDEFDTVEDMQVLARQRWQSRAKRMGIVRDQDES